MRNLFAILVSLFIYQSSFRKRETNRARSFRIEQIYQEIKTFQRLLQILMVLRILLFFIQSNSFYSVMIFLFFFISMQSWISFHNLFQNKYPLIFEKKGKIKLIYLERIETFLGISSLIIVAILSIFAPLVLYSEDLSDIYNLGMLLPISFLLYAEALFLQPILHIVIVYVSFSSLYILILLSFNLSIKHMFYIIAPSITIGMFCKLIITWVTNLNLSIDRYIRSLKTSQEILNALENPIIMVSSSFEFFFKNPAFDEINNNKEYTDKDSVLKSLINDKNVKLNDKINELLYDEKKEDISESFLCQNVIGRNLEINTYMVNLIRKYFKSIQTTAVLVLIKNLGDAIKMEVLNKNMEFTTLMLYSVSHEIRNPINGIVGVLSYLKRKVPFECLNSVYLALGCCEFLTNQVKSVVDYAQIIKGEFALHYSFFNLRKLLKQIIKTGERWIIEKKARIRIEYNISQKFPELILGDSERIKQILLNLLLNSIKFTNEGFIIFEALMPNQFWVEMSVSDSGCGFSKDQILILNKYKGDSFKTIPCGFKSFPGFKLGISQMILEKFHSKIEASILYSGSKLTFIIPQIKEGKIPNEFPTFSNILDESLIPLSVSYEKYRNVQKKHTLRALKNQRSRSFNNIEILNKFILIVDDFESNRFALTSMINNIKKFTIFEASNGIEALKISKEKFSEGLKLLIFMDIDMPLMNGLIASEKIREYSNDPIIIVTAYESEDLRQTAVKLGVNEFLTKPVNIKELKRILNKFNYI